MSSHHANTSIILSDNVQGIALLIVLMNRGSKNLEMAWVMQSKMYRPLIEVHWYLLLHMKVHGKEYTSMKASGLYLASGGAEDWYFPIIFMPLMAQCNVGSTVMTPMKTMNIKQLLILLSWETQDIMDSSFRLIRQVLLPGSTYIYYSVCILY